MIGTRNVKSFTIMQTLRYILKKDGVFGLYRGSVATFWRVLPGSGKLNSAKLIANSNSFWDVEPNDTACAKGVTL